MPNNCRACGGWVQKPSDLLLDALQVQQLPEYCEGLCGACLWQCPNGDDPVNEEQVTQYLVRKTNQIASRVSSGMSIIRCTVLRDSFYAGGGFEQCGFFAHHEVDGHPICGRCKKLGERERLRFIGDDWTPPRRFEIFASSPDELIEEARKRAEAW